MNRSIPFLLLSVLSVAQPIGAVEARAADTAPLPGSEQVIRPEIDRRDIRIPRIDTEDYEVGAYVGILSIEDFGARPVFGARLAYHVNEDYFVESVIAMSSISDEALCNNGLCVLPSRVEDLTYFAVSVGYNLFPSEVFIAKKYAMNASLYLLGGIGSTIYANESHFTGNIGMGIRILPKDWLAMHLTIRDFLFQSDFLGTSKITNNFELSFGMSVYF